MVLPSAGWTHDGDEFSGLDGEIDILQYERLRFGIAEEHVAQLDASENRSSIGQRLVVSPLAWRQRNVREALEMETQYAEVERLLHQRDRLVDEVLPVSHERENHADGQLVGEHQSRREIDGDDRFQAEDQVVHGAESNLGTAEANVRACDFRIAVQPLAFPFGLAIEQLEALNCPHAFDEIRVLLGGGTPSVGIARAVYLPAKDIAFTSASISAPASFGARGVPRSVRGQGS